MNEHLKERELWWPVSPELMASYKDGSHTEKYSDGTLDWSKNGDWHRDGDKPVWIWENGTLIWSKNGLNHRVLGPAVIDGNNNFKWWYKGGQIPVNSQEEYEEWIHKNHPFDNEIKQLYY